MLVGIAGLSVISGTVAAYFVSTDEEVEFDSLEARLARIERQLDRLLAERDGED